MENTLNSVTKPCRTCGNSKPLSEFEARPGRAKDGYRCTCKVCRSEQHSSRWEKVRREAMQVYGGCHCACCGEADYTLLQIDHIGGEGKSHRTENPYAKGHLAQILKKEGFPPGYQVLCRKCNLKKGQFSANVGSEEWRKGVWEFVQYVGGVEAVLAELLGKHDRL